MLKLKHRLFKMASWLTTPNLNTVAQLQILRVYSISQFIQVYFSPLQRQKLWEEHVFHVKNCVFFSKLWGFILPSFMQCRVDRDSRFWSDGLLIGGTVPRKWTKVPWKGTILKRKVVFQARFLRWQDMCCSIFRPVGRLQNHTSLLTARERPEPRHRHGRHGAPFWAFSATCVVSRFEGYGKFCWDLCWVRMDIAANVVLGCPIKLVNGL